MTVILDTAKVFAVYGKGGIGKSTTSSNLSVAFSKLVLKRPHHRSRNDETPIMASTRLPLSMKEFFRIADMMPSGTAMSKATDMDPRARTTV